MIAALCFQGRRPHWCLTHADGGTPKTLEEVSKESGITREWIRQLQNLALAKMRAALSQKEEPGNRSAEN
jgi:DNA-directed RNA polymerase sigma subunit (sigma70/sigma32)